MLMGTTFFPPYVFVPAFLFSFQFSHRLVSFPFSLVSKLAYCYTLSLHLFSFPVAPPVSIKTHKEASRDNSLVLFTITSPTPLGSECNNKPCWH